MNAGHVTFERDFRKGQAPDRHTPDAVYCYQAGIELTA
jgi:hypothetical protein